jgi:signal transduction histidine kinase
MSRFTVSIQFAVLALLGLALLVAIVPAGLVLDRWLARELESRAWRDVGLAPAILEDRNKAIVDALMMHAKEVAGSRTLIAAMRAQDRDHALRAALDAARALNHAPIVVAADGQVWDGPAPTADMLQAARRGEMPVAVVSDSTALFLISVAAVPSDDRWLGVAGVANPLDATAAEGLAGLTRSDLVLVIGPAGSPAVFSAELAANDEIARAAAGWQADGRPHELRIGQARYLVATATFAGATVTFVRDLRRDLAMLPRLRRVLVGSGIGALLLALLLGSVLTLVLVRPVRGLASAADRLTAGDFAAPLASTSVREVTRVTQAFGAMRASLAHRIEELRAANRMLEERQARLSALQAELIRRERVAASGRLAIELAHEIRNPVASLRNCLELLHRRLKDDAPGQEYASLAIDELLRMHELAERMLELYRPHDPSAGQCDAAEVAREVAALARLGSRDARLSVVVNAQGDCAVAMPPDALKQVLLNLVQNAREAMPSGLELRIELRRDGTNTAVAISDNGPGIPADIRTRIFDPFFTTRGTAGGIGLGLYVVEGVVRGYGGRVWASEQIRGTCFNIVLPALTTHVDQSSQPVSTERQPS